MIESTYSIILAVFMVITLIATIFAACSGSIILIILIPLLMVVIGMFLTAEEDRNSI